jgi:hypothetical protein
MDSMHQPRDENGQWVSLTTLFERERADHRTDHEHERTVARDTAVRLERAVEDAVQRLEKSVAASFATHERIHTVEKLQVDKAESAMNKRLEGMNEFRSALQDQASKAVTRELFDAKFDALAEAINKIEKRMAYYSGAAAAGGFLLALVFRLATS